MIRHCLALGASLLFAGSLLAADGAALYSAHCQACHQPGGVGAPGIAPPLAGQLGRFAASEAGRQHLLRVPLTGMVGSITVDGVRYSGNMPSFASLSDAELLALLKHVLGTLDGVADLSWLTPARLAEVRAAGGSPNDTHKQRARLATGG